MERWQREDDTRLHLRHVTTRNATPVCQRIHKNCWRSRNKPVGRRGVAQETGEETAMRTFTVDEFVTGMAIEWCYGRDSVRDDLLQLAEEAEIEFEDDLEEWCDREYREWLGDEEEKD